MHWVAKSKILIHSQRISKMILIVTSNFAVDEKSMRITPTNRIQITTAYNRKSWSLNLFKSPNKINDLNNLASEASQPLWCIWVFPKQILELIASYGWEWQFPITSRITTSAILFFISQKMPSSLLSSYSFPISGRAILSYSTSYLATLMNLSRLKNVAQPSILNWTR